MMPTSRYFRVPLQEIAYVRSVLEGYDGLAILWAPDPRRGEIEWLIGDGLEAEAEELICRLVGRGVLTEIGEPPGWPAPGRPEPPR
jgi:Domain of unknown function (DUF4911)